MKYTVKNQNDDSEFTVEADTMMEAYAQAEEALVNTGIKSL